MNLQSYPTKIPDLVEEELEDELVIYNPNTEKIYNLNPTASFIWKVSNGELTLEEIIREISDAYPATEFEEVKEDVFSLIREMQEDGLIELQDNTTP